MSTPARRRLMRDFKRYLFECNFYLQCLYFNNTQYRDNENENAKSKKKIVSKLILSKNFPNDFIRVANNAFKFV